MAGNRGDMMKIDRLFRVSLRVYASLVLSAALVHSAWYWFMPGYAEMKGLTQIQQSFVSLLNWSITLLLLFFSILAFWVTSKSFTLPQQKVFSLLMAVFWTGRFLFELIYPVQIPLLMIPNPSSLLKVIIAACVAILVSPWLLLRFSPQHTKRQL